MLCIIIIIIYIFISSFFFFLAFKTVIFWLQIYIKYDPIHTNKFLLSCTDNNYFSLSDMYSCSAQATQRDQTASVVLRDSLEIHPMVFLVSPAPAHSHSDQTSKYKYTVKPVHPDRAKVVSMWS